MMSIAHMRSTKLLCKKVYASHVKNQPTGIPFSDCQKGTQCKILTDLAHEGACLAGS